MMVQCLPASERYVDGIGFLCTELGRSRKTVLRWAREGTIPPPDVILNRQTRRHRLQTLLDFLAARP